MILLQATLQPSSPQFLICMLFLTLLGVIPATTDASSAVFVVYPELYRQRNLTKVVFTEIWVKTTTKETCFEKKKTPRRVSDSSSAAEVR